VTCSSGIFLFYLKPTLLTDRCAFCGVSFSGTATDGGRVALSLFGRLGKGAVGSVFLALLLLVGLTGSDLFLFYFSFCIAFQTGNEVPARNEVDKLDIPRVFLATGTYVLAALALIPF